MCRSLVSRALSHVRKKFPGPFGSFRWNAFGGGGLAVSLMCEGFELGDVISGALFPLAMINPDGGDYQLKVFRLIARGAGGDREFIIPFLSQGGRGEWV